MSDAGIDPRFEFGSAVVLAAVALGGVVLYLRYAGSGVVASGLLDWLLYLAVAMAVVGAGVCYAVVLSANDGE